MPSYTKTELRVGILVVIAAVLFGGGIFWIAGPRILHKTYPIYVYFDFVKGLSPGSMVKCAGVNIGWVEKMEHLPDIAQVRVTCQVYKEAKLREDAKARVESTGIVGEFYLEFSFGSRSAPYLKPNGMVEGETAYSLEDVTRELYGTLAALQSFIGDEEARDNFYQILANGAEVSEQLKLVLEDVREATGIQADLRQTVAELRGGAEEFRSLATATNSMVREVSPNISTMMADLSTTTSRIRTEFLDDAAYVLEQMRTVSDNLHLTTRNMSSIFEDNRDRIDRIIASMDAGAVSFATAAERVDRILLEFEEGQGPLKRLITDEEWSESVDGILGSAEQTVDRVHRLTRPSFYYEFRAFERTAERYADNYLRNDAGIAWDITENGRLTIGANDIGNDNEFEMTYGHTLWGFFTPYAGVIESEAAIGADVRLWSDWLHLYAEGIGLTDDDEERVDIFGELRFPKYGSILIGVEDAFDESWFTGGFRLEI